MAIQRLFVIMNLFLITLGSYLVVDTTYGVLKSQFEETGVEAPAVEKTGQPMRRQPVMDVSSYSAITKRNIFNSAPAEVKEEKDETLEIDNLRETELKLKLWGTVTGNKDKAYAVITEEKNRNSQDLYRIGDTIQTATVKMILREKVVLTINGEDQVLSMEEEKSGPSRFSGGRMAGRPSTPAMTGGDTDTVTLERSQIEESLQNINELMRQIKIRPHFSNGKPDGLALSSIRRNSIFKEMGLRNGDIITGVDGTPIESVDDALKFYESISSASNLNLQIKRRGKPKTIEFIIN